MSKAVPLCPSQGCNADRTVGATPPSQRCNTGSSNKKSYSLISSNKHLAGTHVGEIVGEVEIETPARTRRTARFLKGPIPLDRLARAARLPSKALAVYLAVHHRRDLGSRPLTTLPTALLSQFGVSRNGKARALRDLERAGLVQLDRRAGRATRIFLPV